MARPDQYSFSINAFVKGMRCDADADDVGGVYARLLKNVNLQKLGAVTTRYGHELVGNPAVVDDQGYLDPPMPPGSTPDIGVDGWIQGLGSRTNISGNVRWVAVRGGVIQEWDAAAGKWELRGYNGIAVPPDPSDLFRLYISVKAVADTITDAYTLKASTAIFTSDMVGVSVYNLDNGEMRTIQGFKDTDEVFVNRPIDLVAWSGADILIQDDVSIVEFQNKNYLASTSHAIYLRRLMTAQENASGVAGADYWLVWGNETITNMKVRGSMLAVANDSLFIAGNELMPRHLLWTNTGTENFENLSFTANANADVGGSGTLRSTTAIFTREHVGQIVYSLDANAVLRITSFIDSSTVGVAGLNDSNFINDGNASTWDSDTIHLYTNTFAAESNITGIIGVDTQVAVFDNKNLYMVDIVNKTRREFRGKGTISPHSLAVSPDGDLYWVATSGHAYRLPKGGEPIKISQILSNGGQPTAQLGIVELIKQEYMPRIAGGFFNSEYMVNLGTLSSAYFGYTLTNAVSVYNPAQDNWRIDSYVAGRFHTTRGLDGKETLLIGSNDYPAVFKGYVKTNYTDDNQLKYEDEEEDQTLVIDSIIDIWKTTLNRPEQNKQVNLYIRMSSDSQIVEVEDVVSGGTLVEYTRDQETNYHSLARIPNSSEYVTQPIQANIPCESLGIRISSNGRVDVSSVIFECNVMDTQNRRH